VGTLVRELDYLHMQMVKLDQLAENLLASGEGAVLDESSVRVLRALRSMAAEYMRAHDATWHDAQVARGEFSGAARTRETGPQSA